jgi:transposase
MFARAAAIPLKEPQARELKALTQAGTTTQRVARRCRVIMMAHEGISNSAIAQQLGLSRPTINATRKAFLKGGIEGIQRDPERKRSRRVLNKELEQRILDTTLKTKPSDGTHWSVRGLAQRLGVSRMLVHRVWQRFDLQPHRVERFKLSNDPHFDEKVRDVVGLYLDPPDQALVLCVDEKSQIQALDRTRPILPLRPGLPERQTHDYKKYGTTTLFAAFNIMTGKVIGSCLPRQRGNEFVKFLNQLEKDVPVELDVHFTPTSSLWLNQVERWFGLITDRMIRRGTFCSVQELEQAIYEWLATWNSQPKPFIWKATADVILDKVRRCREAIAKS